MNIVYASDDKFAEIAGVSILSLFENNKDVRDICVFMINNGISIANQTKLLCISEKYSRKIIFIDMNNIEKLTGMVLSVGKLSLATFSRLFIASILPKNIDKVIYIDCDTMICNSILPLWYEDLNDYIIGGVLDCTTKSEKKCIFLKSISTYINAGVLLINLKSWRHFEVENMLINYINFFKGKVPREDQGSINGVLSDWIKPLHPKYNYIHFYELYSRKALIKHTGINDFYSENVINEAKQQPTIYHFVGSDDRPWIKGSKHILKNNYIMYRNMTPWIEFPLREQVGFRNNIRAILKCFPNIIYELCKSLKRLITSYKDLLYAKKRLKQSDIALADCILKKKI